MSYRIKVYKDGKYLGNYNEGAIRKGKPAFYTKAGFDFFLPYVQEQFTSPKFEIVIEEKNV